MCVRNVEAKSLITVMPTGSVQASVPQGVKDSNPGMRVLTFRSYVRFRKLNITNCLAVKKSFVPKHT